MLPKDLELLKDKFKILEFLPKQQAKVNYHRIFHGFAKALNFNSTEEVNTRLKLIFRASEHQYSLSEFHRHCDNQGPTITLIRSYQSAHTYGGKNGSTRIPERLHIFGCFASASWNSNGGYIESSGSFLFRVRPYSFEKGKIYERNENAMFGNIKYGPVMGGNFFQRGDIQISGRENFEVFRLD